MDAHHFLCIDKPVGLTSHDVVARLRRITGIRKIGHAGTLDPFATGLLIVGVGREATKKLSAISGHDKEYIATARLGAESDTQDLTGVITPIAATTVTSFPDHKKVTATFATFTGPITQIPPMYSAKKIAGKKLYELARSGITINRAPVALTIHEFVLLDYSPPDLTFRVRCSSGTYIRTLAHDIGHALGTGAYLTALRRTAIDTHRIEQSIALEQITPENWQTFLH